MQFVLLAAILIYIFKNANMDMTCAPSNECRFCPFPCDERNN